MNNIFYHPCMILSEKMPSNIAVYLQLATDLLKGSCAVYEQALRASILEFVALSPFPKLSSNYTYEHAE